MIIINLIGLKYIKFQYYFFRHKDYSNLCYKYMKEYFYFEIVKSNSDIFDEEIYICILRNFMQELFLYSAGK